MADDNIQADAPSPPAPSAGTENAPTPGRGGPRGGRGGGRGAPGGGGGRDGNRRGGNDRNRPQRGGDDDGGEEFIEKLVHINRVSKTVKGGKRFRLCSARRGRRWQGPGRFRSR